ncbi:MAG: thiamine pyrophosphate-dependent dehydrogenase E1 component subunit alpha [Chloroflexi bacterium]|nr:thiamine pyrophosphate-dependent dehydrogenase E1 component subunit alpha [Chloroflexota bacterium]
MEAESKSSVVRSRELSKHAALGLSEDNLLEMYYWLVLTRTLDDRMWALNRQGKVSFVISCRGHEGAQIGSAYAIRRGEDIVLPYYRDTGVALVVGMTPRDIMLSVFARNADPASGARQMPGHFGQSKLKILSGSSPVATQIPHAAGAALASKIKKEKAVTIVYFGDGATSKGDFHEGLNFAGIYKLPVVFICENNGYAISVPQRKQMGITNIADRAAGYGFPGVTVDGNDVLAVYEVARGAIERARRGEGPTLIEAKTFRVVPHSSDDDDRRYRTREEVEEWKKRDPLERFKRYLEEHAILNEEVESKIRDRAIREVADATEFAEKSPQPRSEDLTKNLYYEGPR